MLSFSRWFTAAWGLPAQAAGETLQVGTPQFTGFRLARTGFRPLCQRLLDRVDYGGHNDMAVERIEGASGLRAFFKFPHPVNEYAARSVAAMVFTLTVLLIATDTRWLTIVLAYGFFARVLTGPKLSLMGLIATRFVVPKLIRRSRPVAGPPKQFAQAVGLVFSGTALILIYGFGQAAAAYVVLSVLALFAGLEAFAGFCAGCFVFGYLMRYGIIPAATCERCNDITFDSRAKSSN